MREVHITKRAIFNDLGFEKEEAAHLKMRADLMIALRQHIKTHALSQQAAAQQMGVNSSQISRLLQGDINYFTVDKLIKMLSHIGIKVTFKLAA